MLFWSEIFNFHSKFIFQSQFQSFPLDFYSSQEFYANRMDLFEVKFREYLDEKIDLASVIEQVHTNNLEINCIGINWNIPLNVLKIFVKLMPRSSLLECCKKILLNWKSNSSGFPDLFAWDDAESYYKLIEVKNQNDKPSEKQIYWIHLFSKLNFKFQLIKIEE